MAGEKTIEKHMEAMSMGSKSGSFAALAKEDMASGKGGGPSDSKFCVSSSENTTFSTKAWNTKQAFSHPPTGFYSYYYPGYDRAYREWDDQVYFLRGGIDMPYSGSGFRSATLQKVYNPKVSLFPNQGHVGIRPQNGFTNSRTDGRNWAVNDRVKVRENFNRHGVFGASSDRSRGPRASRVKDPLNSSSDKDQLSSLVQRDQYNLKDFQTKYEQAMFFVIKSYSEDDIHKSIKYNVWASTAHGNEKLNAAFHDAEMRSSEKGIRCPIFLFFSVNASGQFVGLAEMIGQVDFKKSMDFWQQDKWNGFFPVKWHIIKDITNSQLRHIILANNDNKPVTNSRDTQEIGFSQGLEMLDIFKNYPAKTSILDDFVFYEDGEKLKCHRPSPPHLEIRCNNNSPASSKQAFSIITNLVLNSSQKRPETAAGKDEALARVKGTMGPKRSLITLTKDFSLNP
ncbi:YTH domain-containing protein ECT1-like isoform X2 [Magnolia sinica]|uniref:YTH domain-containing protein ECT1-like isoform X2 n=1 Tax=Magnolia sinica TaxID=86752 RepID=UPI0026592954|nr:YTH domain-containing protein ECT1-like isoform X2 [Magnolia sinica]